MTFPSMLCSLKIAAELPFSPAIFDVSHPASSIKNKTKIERTSTWRLFESSLGVRSMRLKFVRSIAGRVMWKMILARKSFDVDVITFDLDATSPIITRIARTAICLTIMPNAIKSELTVQLLPQK